MKPIPILYVHGSADLYGSDRLLLQLIASLDRTRFDPIVLVPRDGPLVAALQGVGVDVQVKWLSVLHRTFDPVHWLCFFVRLPCSVEALRRLIKRRGIRLVHSNTSHVYDGALAARAAGVVHVWHIREVHTGLSKIGYPLSRLIYTHSDKVILMSAAVRRAFFSWRPDDDPKLHIVYDGVDITEFNPNNDGAAVRAELGLGLDVPLVGVVGRLAHWKGHRLFLQAVARVRRSFPAAHFLIVGDAVTPGDHRLKEELLQLVRQLELEEVVTFTGVRSDIPRVMAALNILVLPSELPEPWGMVVLEAMATARPVVATRQGGPLEMVVDGETGYLVPPDDPQPMAEAILSLLRSPEQARAMGRAGRDRCEQRFTAERSCQETKLLYEALLQRVS